MLFHKNVIVHLFRFLVRSFSSAFSRKSFLGECVEIGGLET
jgi:hypothetical protein